MDEQEIRDKIAALQAELERASFEKRRNGRAAGPLVLPPPPRPRPGEKPCPVCRSPRPASGPCPDCSFGPAEARPLPAPAEPGVLDAVRGLLDRGIGLIKEQGFERLLGERLFGYVGMLLVVLGGAFFLKYAAAMSGPWGRVGVGFLTGAGLIAAGQALCRRPRLKALSIPVMAGGWALVQYTAYAAHAVPASRVVEGAGPGFGLLCAAAAGAILHSLAVRSRALTAFAFGAAYFALAAADFGPQTLAATTVLGLAGAWLARELGQPELVPIGLVGYAVNYWPTMAQCLGPAAAGLPRGKVALDLAAAGAVYAAHAVLAPVASVEVRSRAWTDASLAFGAVLLGVAGHAQSAALGPWASAWTGLAVAGLLGLLSGLRGGEAAEPAGAVQGFLAAAFAGLSILRLPGAPAQLWGFVMAAAVLGLSGVSLRRAAFEKYALALAGLGAVCGLGLERGFASAGAMAALGVVSYMLAAFGKGVKREPAWLSAAWVNAGAAAVLGALWTALEPGAFCVAALGFGLVLRGFWLRTGIAVLFQQGLVVEALAGLYFLTIDFGANAALLGPLTPRALTGAVLTLGYAGLLASPGAPEGGLLGISNRRWRGLLSWLAVAVAARAAYGEFNPALRLCGMAAAAVGLLHLGRRRGELADDLRAQAYVVASALPLEALAGDLKPPAVLAALLLLVPLAWRAWGGTDAERAEERGAGHALAALSLALLAIFVGQEASGPMLTLGWTAAGGSYLLAGLAARRRELRWPALGLLGLCVGKAFLHDLTGLALPYRMASLTGLGALLVLCSFAYVRLTKDGADGRAA